MKNNALKTQQGNNGNLWMETGVDGMRKGHTGGLGSYFNIILILLNGVYTGICFIIIPKYSCAVNACFACTIYFKIKIGF